MKNNTLHKQLKEFFDLWFNAEKAIIQEKIEFVKMASKIKKNRDGLINYLDTDIEKMTVDLIERANKLNQKRFNIMAQFPVDRNTT